MADGKKKKPRLEYLLAPGDYGVFSFSGKGDTFVPKLHARYYDEDGNLKALKDGGETDILLNGMTDIGHFMKEVVPSLTKSGRLPDGYETVGTVKLVSDDSREYIKNHLGEALDYLRRIVPEGYGNDQAEINRALAEGAGNAPIPEARGGDILKSPSIAKAIEALKNAGYSFVWEDKSDPKSFSRWVKDGKTVNTDPDYDEAFDIDPELHPDIFNALRDVITSREQLLDLYDTEGAEETLTERLNEALKTGDFNPLFGPRAPNYVELVNRPHRTFDGDEITVPLVVGGKDAAEKVKKYPRYGIDILDLSSPFFEDMFGEDKVTGKSDVDAQRIELNRSGWDAKAKDYIKKAHKHAKTTIKKDKDGKLKKATQTYYSISPKHLLAMPEKFRNQVFDLIKASGGKAFPGLLDSEDSDGLLRHLYNKRLNDFVDDASAEDKAAWKKAHEESVKDMGVKTGFDVGRPVATTVRDSEGKAKGVRTYSSRELNRRYKDLIKNMLSNDGKYNSLDGYIRMYGKKIMEDPELVRILKEEKDIKDIYYDGMRRGDPVSSIADTIMASGVNLLKKMRGEL